MHRSLRLPFLTLFVLTGGCATVGRSVGGVPNLATVEPGPEAIYRGGQPSREGFQTLADLGVKTVIDLRDDNVRWEKQVVTGHGMTYVHVPSNASRMDDAAVARILDAVAQAERPVYIHCHRGRDRTGLTVGAYRLVHQSDEWTRQEVITDLRAHGHQRLFFPGIERFLRSFEPAEFAPASDADAQAASENAGG